MRLSGDHNNACVQKSCLKLLIKRNNSIEYKNDDNDDDVDVDKDDQPIWKAKKIQTQTKQQFGNKDLVLYYQPK